MWRSSRRRCGGCWRCATGCRRTASPRSRWRRRVYWKPPWAILEDEFECLLVNARHVKQVPGRKTDVSDAAWLCQPARGRAVEGELRAAEADPHLAQLDPLPQGADRRASTRSESVAQDPRGHRDQARLRRKRHPRRLRTGDARRALPWHDRPGGAGRARQGQAAAETARAARGRWRVASTPSTGSSSRRFSPTSISSTSRSTGSPMRSRSRSALSPKRLSCSARSPACNSAPLR